MDPTTDSAKSTEEVQDSRISLGSDGAPDVSALMALHVSVQVTEATKNGEIIEFKLIVKQEGEEDFVILRHYEDFQFLNHTIKSEVKEEGVIYPPIPPAPLVGAKQIAKASKEQYGADSSILMAEGYITDCQLLEKYMKLVLAHPHLNGLPCLRKFLLEKNSPQRAKVKPGVMTWLTSSINDYMKASHKDIDEFYENERHKQTDQLNGIKEMTAAFHQMLCCQFRLSTTENYLSSVLSSGNIYSEDSETLQQELALFTRLSEVYKDETHVDEVSANNSLISLARTLDLLSSYHDSVKETILRRTVLMTEYESAMRALETAKPQKVAQLTETKKVKEELYEESSKVLKEELERFAKFRVTELSRSLSKFAEYQITTAVDRHALLIKHLNRIKNMPI